MKISFLDKSTFPNYAELIRPKFDHQWEEFDFTTPDQVVERAQYSEILIVNKVRLPEEKLKELPKLKFIALTATGYDNVDIAYCNKNEIKVSNVVNYGTTSVVEHTFTLIFSLLKNLSSYQKTVKQGNWEKSKYFAIFSNKINELEGKNIVIIGAGTLGQGVAKVAEALNMKIYYVGRKGKSYENLAHPVVDLEAALPLADIVTLHLPLTSESKDLITDKELRLMKPTSIIINTARGGIINEEDLKNCLIKKGIAGAGIDVLSEEPPVNGNPLLTINDLDNLIITPHVAWGGQNSVNNLMRKAIENIEAFYSGKPTSLVTKN